MRAPNYDEIGMATMRNCDDCGEGVPGPHEGDRVLCGRCDPESPRSAVTYCTFLRSARNFDEFPKPDKEESATALGLTLGEARQLCKAFNDNRTQAQIEAGTMLEFTREQGALL